MMLIKFVGAADRIHEQSFIGEGAGAGAFLNPSKKLEKFFFAATKRHKLLQVNMTTIYQICCQF